MKKLRTVDGTQLCKMTFSNAILRNSLCLIGMCYRSDDQFHSGCNMKEYLQTTGCVIFLYVIKHRIPTNSSQCTNTCALKNFLHRTTIMQQGKPITPTWFPFLCMQERESEWLYTKNKNR